MYKSYYDGWRHRRGILYVAWSRLNLQRRLPCGNLGKNLDVSSIV